MQLTVCRPLRSNVPDAPPGATLATCAYCGAECWKLAIEPDPLPLSIRAACTVCALKRMFHQREMDRKLAERK